MNSINENQADAGRSPNPTTPEVTVLVMANDEEIIRQVKTISPDWSLKVIPCSSQEALKSLSGLDADICLLHPDSLPGDAIGTCTALVNEIKSIPVFLLKTSPTLDEQLQCIRSGGEGFLSLPLDPVRLTEILSAIVNLQHRLPAKILWVDDDAKFLNVSAKILQNAGFQVITVTNPMETFTELDHHQPDILLLDYEMPAVSGVELCRMIRLRSEYKLLPILMVTAYNDSVLRRKCLEAGADDFINKPIESAELMARIEVKVIKGDVMRSLVNQDPLTHLYNHRSFLEHLHREFSRTSRYGYNFSLVLLDVDNFSHINEKHSFTKGDEVLRQVALDLRERFRKSDILSRYGSDEFALILAELESELTAHLLREVLAKLRQVSFQSFGAGGAFKVSFCAGIVSCPGNGDTPNSLMTNAMAALKHAKEKGPGTIEVSLSV